MTRWKVLFPAICVATFLGACGSDDDSTPAGTGGSGASSASGSSSATGGTAGAGTGGTAGSSGGGSGGVSTGGTAGASAGGTAGSSAGGTAGSSAGGAAGMVGAAGAAGGGSTVCWDCVGGAQNSCACDKTTCPSTRPACTGSYDCCYTTAGGRCVCGTLTGSTCSAIASAAGGSVVSACPP